MRVLLVDDDEDTVTVMQVLLELSGYQAHGFTTFAKAEAFAETWTPNVLLVDLLTPEGKSDVFAAKLRQAIPNLLVVVITGFPAPHKAAHWYDHYMIKPIDPEELFRVFDQHRNCQAPPGAV